MLREDECKDNAEKPDAGCKTAKPDSRRFANVLVGGSDTNGDYGRIVPEVKCAMHPGHRFHDDTFFA